MQKIQICKGYKICRLCKTCIICKVFFHQNTMLAPMFRACWPRSMPASVWPMLTWGVNSPKLVVNHFKLDGSSLNMLTTIPQKRVASSITWQKYAPLKKSLIWTLALLKRKSWSARPPTLLEAQEPVWWCWHFPETPENPGSYFSLFERAYFYK